ncbi:hypothetical protein PIROE2DRAFT_11981 [Piromyces sp. E2]|nr:hypothetical protein PIROE2DRAFT_11981 [Piromyces sp. E2]|eukprot:OUM61911.1 hypothetical protein PIROE2DRAFT_11981 [Piromyces sp. E2]
MKFTIPLYTLVATSAVLAYPQFRDNSKLPEECDPIFIKRMDICGFKESDLDSPETLCSIYRKEECQLFYKNFRSDVIKCDLADEVEMKTFNTFMKMMEYYCVVDENNKPCPFSRDEFKENENKAINESCKSKICTDAFVNVLGLMKGTIGLSEYEGKVINKDYDKADDNSAYYAMAFLKSDYCTSQHVKSSGTTNANAANAVNNTPVNNTPVNNTPVNNTPANNATAANNTPVINASANNATVTGQQNAQSSGATTMKYSVFGTLLAIAFALL